MSIGDELLYDFDFKRPRVLIGSRFGVVDNVKRLVLLSEESIIADCGAFFVSLSGEELSINRLEDNRMHITGEIRQIELYQGKEEEDG